MSSSSSSAARGIYERDYDKPYEEQQGPYQEGDDEDTSECFAENPNRRSGERLLQPSSSAPVSLTACATMPPPPPSDRRREARGNEDGIHSILKFLRAVPPQVVPRRRNKQPLYQATLRARDRAQQINIIKYKY